MDGQRFDTAIRSLAQLDSRRAVSKALAGGAFAVTLAAFGRRDAAAKCVNPGKQCKGKHGKKLKCCGGAKCKSGKCQCATGLHGCGSQCLDLKTDLDNCGTCGDACASNEICQSGYCCTESGPTGPHNACCHGFVCNPPGQNCVCIV